MFKRLFWLVVGASFGFGASFWVSRAVKQTMERYSPPRLSGELSHAIQAFGTDIRAAVTEGKEAMREHEAALRAQMEGRTAHGR
jgi:hypothetical protein